MICYWKIVLALMKYSSPAAAAIRTMTMRLYWSSCARAIWPNTERGAEMKGILFLLKLLLKIAVAPVILVLTLFVWLCAGLVYVSGLVLGLVSMVLGLLGVAVLITYSPQNGIILLILAFLVSPYGLPLAAIWLLGKVQDLKFAIQDLIYG